MNKTLVFFVAAVVCVSGVAVGQTKKPKKIKPGFTVVKGAKVTIVKPKRKSH